MSNHNALTTKGWEDLSAALSLLASGGKEKRGYTAEEFFRPAQVLKMSDSGAFVMDSCVPDDYASPYYESWADGYFADLPDYIQPFVGYGRIAQLRQDVIYQNTISTFAEEMTEEFCRPETLDEERLSSDIVKEIEHEAIEKWKLDRLFRDGWGGFFGWDGGGLMFIDIKGHDTNEILEQELVLDPQNIAPDSLRGFRVVEAINCEPHGYDATNPLCADYYNPTHWRILGRKIHRTRFLYFSQNKLPAILRPLYNFFGVPWVQMLEPFRAGFEEARVNSLDSIRNHALLYMKLAIRDVVGDGCSDASAASFKRRVQLFEGMRRNDKLAVIDSSEEFAQIVTPLTELADLVTLNLQLYSMATRVPVTKQFGTPPPGMDASGDNYKEDWAKTVAGAQRTMLHEPAVTAYKVIQLNKWGKIFEPLTYRWPKRLDLSAAEKLDLQLKKAQVDQIYSQPTGTGDSILAVPEVRGRLARDPDSGYQGIEADIPEEYRNDSGYEDGEGEEESHGERNETAPFLASTHDEWKEEEHPRADDGTFGEGSAGKAKSNEVNEDEAANVSVWGDAFPEFSGKPAEAIKHLIKEKRGYVPGALWHESIGPIDLPWGDGGFGLSHIISQRNNEGRDGESLVRDLQGILRGGRIVRNKSDDRVLILTNQKGAVIKLERSRNSWLLTAFYRK